MKPQITKAQQIIDIIEPIPAEKFIPGKFGDGQGNCCFIGHINTKLNKDKKLLGIIPINDPKAFASDWNGYGARQLTRQFLRDKHGIYHCDGAAVNNEPTVNGYNEPVIKDRIMHMLKDMVEAGY